jgi:serine protease AprX
LSSIAAQRPQPLQTVHARTSWGFAAGICLLALLTAVAVSPFAGPVASDHGTTAGAAPVTPKLARLAQSDPGRPVEVIVRMEPGASTDAAQAFVADRGGRTGASIDLINGFSAHLGAGDAQRLAARPGVAAVSLNGTTKPQSAGFDANDLATSFNQSVRTPKVWNKDATGKGIGVAVVDTGIAGGLPDFRGADGSRVVASAVTNPDATTAEDAYGHGTHVAGLIAGDSSARADDDPLQGDYAGAAPDAHLISIKASDDHGESSVLDVIYGIEFAVEHKDEFNIRVLNLSLESTEAESYRTDPLDAAVEAAWFNGIVVVAAAGNRGSDADSVDYAPGNDPYAISVGAVDDQGTKRTNDDLPTDWSSRGTTQDGYAKPDLYAPGARIVSNLAPGSDFASMCPDCVSGDGQYIRAGGTSMSAPVVAGAVAALLEEHPSWTPDQVKGALANNLRELPHGGQELDALAAYKAHKRDLVSNEGLEPNEIVNPATGEVDWDRSRWSRSRWSRSRWSRSRWSAATGSLSPSWAGASYVCDCEVVDPQTGEVDPARSRWSRSRWSRSRWSTNWTY